MIKRYMAEADSDAIIALWDRASLPIARSRALRSTTRPIAASIVFFFFLGALAIGEGATE
jgi:hypothetical protein